MFSVRYHIAGTCFCALIALSMSQTARAQSLHNTTQHLVLTVAPITRLTVSGDPGPLIVYLTPGMRSTREVQDASSQYSMTTNGEQLKAVVSIDRAMPRGMQLFIELESEHGMSKGRVDISHALAPVDVVTGIRTGVERSARIIYSFSVESAIDFPLLDSRIVTLTLTE